MKKHYRIVLAAILLFAHSLAVAKQAELDVLQAADIFNLEYAADLEISRDAKTVYFVRHFMDIQTDRKLGNIWAVDVASSNMTPITTGSQLDYSPRLSADGKRLAFISTRTGKAQIFMLWLDTGRVAQLTNLTASPSNLVWSPDDKQLAFSMFVPAKASTPVTLSGKPAGAKWADAPIFIDDVYYRADGGGYATKGSSELFLLPAQGGTPRQLTDDKFNNGGQVSWSQDGKSLVFSANRGENFEFTPLNSDLFRLEIATQEITRLTDRDGPDASPKVSPDGKLIAFLGFDDQRSNYENSQLYTMRSDGSDIRVITADLDRSIDGIAWQADSQAVYIQYDDQGNSVLASQPLSGGKRTILTNKLGGQSYGRPYTSAEFAVSHNGVLAFTYSQAERPADVAVVANGKTKLLTQLNEDALAHKTLARVEEIWFKSKADGRDIQGWVAYPPGYDKNNQYPLILEIHGGPVTAYGPHFSMEIQLFAAPGNVVLYINPRGSSSYGKEFANTIDKNYPSQDYDDLISAVDVLVDKGIADPEKLYVTGGSGGGVLTAWIVGQTDRFAAAVVAKPVINWISFVLTADFYPYFYQYWFDKKPWEDIQGYMQYSPLTYVGNVTTPTMLLTGESDYRTPISETEQYYQALKIQGVETAMVRIPDASHSIYRKPSNLMAKVEYILWWFKQHGLNDTPNQVQN